MSPNNDFGRVELTGEFVDVVCSPLEGVEGERFRRVLESSMSCADLRAGERGVSLLCLRNPSCLGLRPAGPCQRGAGFDSASHMKGRAIREA